MSPSPPTRAIALLALLAAGCLTSPPPRPTAEPIREPPAAGAPPEEVARAYLDAWAAGDREAQRRLTLTPVADFDELHRRFNAELGVVSSQFDGLRVESPGESEASVSFRAVHLLRGLGEWSTEARLGLVRGGEGWRVRWSPAAFHGSLRPGDRLERTRTRPARAEILDASGEPLTRAGEVIAIGVNPSRIANLEDVVGALQRSTGADPARVRGLIEAARGADTFVGVIDVRPERFATLRAQLDPVRGVFFRKKTARLSPSEGFAAHTLGRVGEVTAELLAQLGLLYQQGDTVGLSGLERAHEALLAGTPSGEIVRVSAEGERLPIFRFEGVEGQPLRTTLQPALQLAAEAALEGVTQPAAIVAVDSATGAILAVVSRPLGGAPHRALASRYPPGSTFKVVTTEALVAEGVEATEKAPCPAELRVSGKTFRNFEGEAFPQGTLRTAFAFSCNTAFIALASTLTRNALEDAARRFGFGVAYEVGLPSGGASFPAPVDAVEAAAAAIGQGRVLATPLHMATVAAAAEVGTWRAPFLVQREGEERPAFRLKSNASAVLRTLMRAVVTEGSARTAAGTIERLAGKTGTAEFGTSTPPQTHAWFIGFRDGIAFSVLVEGGGVGGRVAAPIAARFVQRWPAPEPEQKPSLFDRLFR